MRLLVTVTVVIPGRAGQHVRYDGGDPLQYACVDRWFLVDLIVGSATERPLGTTLRFP